MVVVGPRPPLLPLGLVGLVLRLVLGLEAGVAYALPGCPSCRCAAAHASCAVCVVVVVGGGQGVGG